MQQLNSLNNVELLQLIKSYDEYIQDANDEDYYDTRWRPVSIDEYYGNEYQSELEPNFFENTDIALRVIQDEIKMNCQVHDDDFADPEMFHYFVWGEEFRGDNQIRIKHRGTQKILLVNINKENRSNILSKTNTFVEYGVLEDDWSKSAEKQLQKQVEPILKYWISKTKSDELDYGMIEGVCFGVLNSDEDYLNVSSIFDYDIEPINETFDLLENFLEKELNELRLFTNNKLTDKELNQLKEYDAIQTSEAFEKILVEIIKDSVLKINTLPCFLENTNIAVNTENNEVSASSYITFASPPEIESAPPLTAKTVMGSEPTITTDPTMDL